MRWSKIGTSGGTVTKGGKVFSDKYKYPMGATGGSDVSNCFNPDGGGTGI